MNEMDQLLTFLDEAFSAKSWHGTTLRGSIRGLSAEAGSWRAPDLTHSIADIVVHCAYWKYTVRRRLRGEPRGSFALKGSDWFELPDPLDEKIWKGYAKLIVNEHHELREAASEVSPGELNKNVRGGKVTKGALLRGIALHDIYHAGQIQMIKGRMKRER